VRIRALILVLVVAAAAFPASAPAAERSHFAPFEGVRVHYESLGTGKEALVFIHGWSCNLTFWRGQSPVYNKQRSLLVDLPGHGESDTPVVPYPAEYLARGVEAAMRDAGVDRVVLVGHSLGGLVIHAFLRLFPEKVKAVVLVDPAFPLATPGPAERAGYDAKLAERASSLSGPNGRRAFEARIEGFFTPMTPASVKQEIRTKMMATPEHVRVAAVSSPSELGPPPAGEIYNMPALVLAAVKAGHRYKADAERAYFPRIEVDQWRGYGHFLMMEDPVRFNRRLLRFLTEFVK
jgi:pimeloyl-ACP methyl ester carboxylesterase